MKLPSLDFLLQSLLAVCRRFPLTMLSALIAVVSVVTLLERSYEDEEWVLKCWLLGALGIAWFTALTAFAESRAWPPLRKWLLTGAGLALLLLYYFLLDPKAYGFEQIGLPRYLALLAAAHLLAAFAPYLNRLPVADFWEYNKNLFATAVVGAAYTLILWGSLSFAILAVKELFNLQIDNRIYPRLFAVLAGIFNTAFFLHHFPSVFRFQADESTYTAVYKNLCKFILIPVVALYFLILYAYSAKILVTWTLPQGWVSSLVIGFAAAGIFTYLLNFLLPKFDDSAMSKAYRRWFWWVLLPLLALLFVAIGRRIADYGVTEPRFVVAHTGVWLLVCAVYFMFSKKDNIKFIPISMAGFVLVAVLGPFSMFKVAERNQIAILSRLLEKNGRWENGKAKPGAAQIAPDEADRILSALSFLGRRGALEQAAWLPAVPDSLDLKSYSGAYNLGRWLGVQPGATTPVNYVVVTVTAKENASVSGKIPPGYQAYHLFHLGSDNKPESGRYFEYSEERSSLQLHEKNGDQDTVLETYVLLPKMREWYAKQEYSNLALAPGSETFNLPGRKIDLRLVLKRAEMERTGDKYRLIELEALALMKEK